MVLQAEVKSKKVPPAPAAQKETTLPVRSSGKRRKGHLRLIEIFTWSCVMTMVAFGNGWETSQPVTLPHWDLLRADHRDEVRHYLQKVDPDMIMIAPDAHHGVFYRG